MSKKKTPTGAKTKHRFPRKQFEAAVTARDRAAAGTPKEVITALLSGAGEFQPVTLATLIVLEAIKSPFITEAVSKETPMLDITRALYVLSLPIEEVDKLVSRSLLNDKQPLAIFDGAVKAFAQRVPLNEIASVGARIDAHIAKAMSTAIPHGDPGGSVPLEKARPQVAAAPGSDGSSSTTTP